MRSSVFAIKRWYLLVFSAVIFWLSSGLGLANEVASSEHLTFQKVGSYGYAATFQIALGDLDGDGDLDAVFANMHARSEIWRNNGQGRFTNAYKDIGGEAHGVGLGDLDSDGDLDMVLAPASNSEGSRIYFNDGAGHFTLASTALGDAAITANSLELIDADGDGDLDISVYYVDGQRHCRLYTNDGQGQFTLTEIQFPGIAAWGDIDNDGDRDAICLQHGQTGSGVKVFVNHGALSFAEAQHISAPVFFAPGTGALGDIDGDEDLDLVIGGGSSLDSPLTLLRNDGAGFFTYDPSSSFSAYGARVSLGDFNSDGATDVYLGCLNHAKLIGLGDSRGQIVDSGILLGDTSMAGVAAIGDLDGDGDLDLFIAIYGQGGPNEVWLNAAD